MIESILENYRPERALPKLLSGMPSCDPIYEHLQATQAALQSGDWSQVDALFKAQRFIDQSGWFWLLGPYSVVRGGKTVTSPTSVFGRVLETTHPEHLRSLAHELFGQPCEELSPLMAVEIHGASGHAGSESGEAFLVPDGWGFPESEQGPALNDMREQRRRYSSAGRACIQRIFEEESAELLLSAMDASDPWYSLQHQEFAHHEVGHATGLGLKRKLAAGLLVAVQSHRQDSIQLTQDENALGVPEGIWGLYGSIHVARSSRNLFRDLIVEPCHGIYSKLN